MFYEYFKQHDESNYFPLGYSTFEFLKQILRSSKRIQKLEDMAFSEIDNEKGEPSCNQSQIMRKTTIFPEGLIPKEEDEKGEQIESALHSNPPFYEKVYGQPSNVQTESHTNFLCEDCRHHVENYGSNVFKGDFSMPIYDECKDGYLDNAPKQPIV